ELVAERGLARKLFHGIEPFADPRGIEQRVEKPTTEDASAHRGLSSIQHPKERAHALTPDALDELEVSSARVVDHEELFGLVGLRRAQVLGADELPIEVAEQGAERCRRQRACPPGLGSPRAQALLEPVG